MTESNGAQQVELQQIYDLIGECDRLLADHKEQLLPLGDTTLIAASQAVMGRLMSLRHAMGGVKMQMQQKAKEREQLRVLQEVSALINSSLDLTAVLNQVMDSIISLTGAERGFLMLIGEQTGELEVQAARNMDQQTIEASQFSISRSIVDGVVRTGEPVVTTDAQDDPRFAEQHSIISFNLRSILCVPLRIKDQSIGVIYADSRIVSGIFSDSDRDILASFAHQAAIAIENARLFSQIRNHLASILEMKNLMDNVFESIPSGVITIDTFDRISLFNQAAGRILGLEGNSTYNQLYQQTLASLQPDVDVLVNQAKNRGGHYNTEVDIVIHPRPGISTLNLTCSPLRDELQHLQGVALVVDDISEKKRLDSVRRYLPPALVDQIRDLDAAQQPQRRQISTFFADIRGFSTFGEDLDPEKLVQIINVYFTVAAEAITENEGVIDKFMGDAVMATYNTTLNPQADHAARAVRTALEMQARMRTFHKTVDEDSRLYFGMGVHTGEAVVGNVGSQFRKDYTAIGDSVNLAKRLQEMASPNQILISQQVYELVQDWVVAESMGEMQVKGRQAKVQVHILQGTKS